MAGLSVKGFSGLVELIPSDREAVVDAARTLRERSALGAEHAVQLAVGIVLRHDPDDFYWGPPGHHTADLLLELMKESTPAGERRWVVETLVHLNLETTVEADSEEEAIKLTVDTLSETYPEATLIDPQGATREADLR